MPGAGPSASVEPGGLGAWPPLAQFGTHSDRECRRRRHDIAVWLLFVALDQVDMTGGDEAGSLVRVDREVRRGDVKVT